ncbi:MAG: YkgJ family cysteine cluster protein, partial [Planctomycetota bacterium]
DAVDAAAFEDLRRRLADRAARAEGLTAGAYRQARIPCAFLEESGECRIYERRPVKCRVHVSMSETACQETEGPLPLHQWLTWVGRAIHRGMSGDPLQELHGAVLAALNGDA